MPPGCIAVVDAMGITDAGIFGDILCQRMKVRGVAGLVTDGVVRDLAGVLRNRFARMVQGSRGAAIGRGSHLCQLARADWLRRRRGFPDDVIVVDEDGAVVIPSAILNAVVEAAVEQEKLEAWIIGEVQAGALLPDLYPPNAENRATVSRPPAATNRRLLKNPGTPFDHQERFRTLPNLRGPSFAEKTIAG
jgi:hypothetical protein